MLAKKTNTLAMVFTGVEKSRINESILDLIFQIQYARIFMHE